MLNNPNQAPGEWTKYPVKSLPDGVSYTRAVLFGQYLVVIAHEKICSKKSSAPPKDHPQASLLAIDLQDKNVEEAQIDNNIFGYHDEYTLTKYGENQMIKFGGSHHNNITGTMILITIKSFKPFLVEYAEIESQNRAPKIRLHTAQIYKNSLYIFGGRSDKYFTGPENTTWKSREWKKYPISDGADDDGKEPNNVKEFNDGTKPNRTEEPGPRDRPSSFIVDDELYIYGGEGVKGGDHSDLKDIFVLAINTMTWKKFKQHEAYLQNDLFPDEIQLSGDIYRDNLILLGGSKYSDDTLFCWNYRRNSWSTFKIENMRLTQKSNLIVSNHSLLVLGQDEKELSLATFNLENITWPNLKQTDKEYRCSLFMNKEKSDISIKVGDQIIPAHKKIMREKSRFFFESYMSESRQGIVEVKDCDYIVLREFLRFVYYEKVDFHENFELALKLLKLADKNQQENLRDLCMNYLRHQIDSRNFFPTLSYARENNLIDLQEMCKSRFSDLLKLRNLINLIKGMNQEERPEFVQGNLEFRNRAFDFILEKLKKIDLEQEDDIKFYEDFLIQNINMDNIKELVLFLDSLGERFKLSTAHLRDSVYDFLQKNWEDPEINLIRRECPNEFYWIWFLL